MSTAVPLQYESLKMVIQYLDTNLRFKLAQHIPSICRTEKVVPLKLDNLSFSEMAMSINDTSYRLSICLDHHRKTPLCHQICNGKGAVQHDLYQWGSDTDSGEDVILPGNLAIPDRRFFSWQHRESAPGPEFFERHLRAYQTALARRVEQGEQLVVLPESGPIPKEWTYHAVFWVVPQGFDAAELERHDDSTHCGVTKKKGETNEGKPKGKQIYRYNYSMKLSTALKNIASRLLSGRRHAINVKAFGFPNDHLPVEFKARIRNLKIEDLSENYEALKHNIDDSSQPLDFLSVSRMKNFRNWDLGILKTAKRLYIDQLDSDFNEYSAVFMKFENPVVNMNFEPWAFTLQDQINFIRNWMQAGRPVGATFSYRIPTIDGLMAQIREQLRGTMVGKNTATLQMSSVVVRCRESVVNSTWTVKLQMIKNPNRLH